MRVRVVPVGTTGTQDGAVPWICIACAIPQFWEAVEMGYTDCPTELRQGAQQR